MVGSIAKLVYVRKDKSAFSSTLLLSNWNRKLLKLVKIPAGVLTPEDHTNPVQLPPWCTAFTQRGAGDSGNQ